MGKTDGNVLTKGEGVGQQKGQEKETDIIACLLCARWRMDTISFNVPS